jgi:hypothetical protein
MQDEDTISVYVFERLIVCGHLSREEYGRRYGRRFPKYWDGHDMLGKEKS